MGLNAARPSQAAGIGWSPWASSSRTWSPRSTTNRWSSSSGPRRTGAQQVGLGHDGDGLVVTFPSVDIEMRYRCRCPRGWPGSGSGGTRRRGRGVDARDRDGRAGVRGHRRRGGGPSGTCGVAAPPPRGDNLDGQPSQASKDGTEAIAGHLGRNSPVMASRSPITPASGRDPALAMMAVRDGRGEQDHGGPTALRGRWRPQSNQSALAEEPLR